MKTYIDKSFTNTSEKIRGIPKHQRRNTINPTVYCEFNNSKGSKSFKSQFQPSINKIFLKYRERHIEFLEELCRAAKTGLAVQILATKIFDIVNSLRVFSVDRYEALIIVCWSLATKFDCDDMRLGLEQLAECADGLSEDGLRKLEVEVLKILDWKIARKTSLYYVEKYKEKGVVKREEMRNKAGFEKVDEKVGKYSITLAEVANRIPELVLESDKIVACSCIAFARKKLGLRNYWSNYLEKLTGINEKELRIQELENKYYCLINNKF